VRVGLIIAMYNLNFVFFDSALDLKNFDSAKEALSAFAILALISCDQSFFVLRSAPKYWNSPTFSKAIDSNTSCGGSLSRIVKIFVFFHINL
jgi:hypothetical protein